MLLSIAAYEAYHVIQVEDANMESFFIKWLSVILSISMRKINKNHEMPGLKKILYQIIPFVIATTAIIYLYYLLRLPFTGRTARAFINEMYKTGLRVLNRLCMQVFCVAVRTCPDFRYVLIAVLALADHDIYYFVLCVYSRYFIFVAFGSHIPNQLYNQWIY